VVPFHPLAYSTDLLVPGIDLQQKAFFEPIVPAEGPRGLARFVSGWIRAQVALGWVLTTLGFTGLSGLIKRD